MKTSRARIVAFASATAVVGLVAACGDLLTTGKGGGANHDYSNCKASGDSRWNSHDATIYRVKPACPTTIFDRDSLLEMSFDVGIPDADVFHPYEPSADAYTSDVFTHYQVAYGSVFMNYDADSGKWVGVLDGSGHPGWYPDPDNADAFFDSTDVVMYETTSSPDIHAYASWPGHITSGSGTVIGDAAVTPGSGYSWRIQTEWDTSGYRFQWYLDGTPSTPDTGAVFATSFSDFGTHTLRVDQILSDNSVVTSYQTVNVVMSVGITGPSGGINPYEEEDWSASIPFGHAPYTYQWYIDGSPAGTDASLSSVGFLPSTSHDITVDVWDSQSHHASAATSVITNSGTCDPYCTRPPSAVRSAPRKVLTPVKPPVPTTQRRPVKWK